MSAHHGKGINISLGSGVKVFHMHYDWDSSNWKNSVSKTDTLN
jgi:hypothetical protein